jgi:hypothetical protein
VPGVQITNAWRVSDPNPEVENRGAGLLLVAFLHID